MAKNEHFLPSWNNLLSKRWNVVWTVGHSVFFFERRAMTKMTKKSSLRLSHLSWVVIVNIAYYDQWYYHKLLNLVKNKSLCNRRLSILVIRFFSFSFSIISSQAGEETWLGSSLVVIKSKDKQDALKACNWASTCKKNRKTWKEMKENVREGDCRRFCVFPSSLTQCFMPPGSLSPTDIRENSYSILCSIFNVRI